MGQLKSSIGGALRWGWFGFLLLLAFSYLVAGLSTTDKTNSSASRFASTSDSDPDVSVVDLDQQAEDLRLAVAKVDEARERQLEKQGLQAAPMADWLTVCRRMSLALVGNGLSLEEIRQLEQLPESKRVTAHMNALLGDSRYHHYWGERWTRFLVGTDNGQFVLYRRRRFRVWLAEVFANDWRYDQMVRRLITAEGLWTDRPEVNFLTATFDSNNGQPDPVRLAARTSRAFLGLRIDCLQCHNDFLGNVNLGDVDEPREGLQTDFHQLAAFFTSAKTSGLQGVKSGQPDYKYKYLDATEEVEVEPAVPYSPELLPDQGNVRDRLARWITHPDNRQAARSAVSHVWALMYGRSAVNSVDNLPLDEETTPMLEALTDDFIANGFDIRRLIRLIVYSSAFRAESQADFEITEQHEDAGAVFPLVRLRPEQMAGAIIQSARIKSVDRESSLFVQLQKFGGMNDFISRYGDVGEDEFSTESVTITQRLVMLNGSMIRDIVNSNPILNASAHIDMFAKDNQHAVEIVYLCVLNRYPSDVEREHFVGRLETANRRSTAIEDLFWVLLNSTELAWNH
ncbi:MAG: DUF1553 domain-containing protein [Pirellulaceae bacterium]|nr:DUF1553 domain-containing protein [Pirellulaceae bacterium]